MKSILLSVVLMLLTTSCSTVSNVEKTPQQSTVFAYEKNPIDISQSPTVLLRIKNDTGHFAENISRRIEALGFKMTADTGQPDYFAEVDYKTYFDVVHNTFVYFEIAFVDAKTKVVNLRLRYVGGLQGFNGCDKALNMLFRDASGYVKKGT